MGNEKYYENFRTNLKLLREYHGMTLRELGEKIGCTPQYIHVLESYSHKFPPIEKLIKIAGALDTTPGRLLDVNHEEITDITRRLVVEYFLPKK